MAQEPSEIIRHAGPGLAALAVSALGLVGCVAPGTDLNALPLFRHDRLQAMPNAKGRASPSSETTVPLLMLHQQRTEADDHVRLTLPYPLMTYQRKDNDSRLSLFAALPAGPALLSPLRAAFSMDARSRKGVIGAYALDHERPDGGLDTDRALLPLVAWGQSEDEGSYLLVAPFGGTLKGILGKDEATFYGFPLPFYLHMRDEGFESRHLLFPFFNWVEGEGRDGFRVFPFYGHYTRHDEDGRLAYERSWLMWPFITWQTNGANLMKTEDDGSKTPVPPTEVLAVLPFYAHVRGPEIDELDLLYPLFRWTRLTRDNGWELRAPFPFVILSGNDAGEGQRDFWPLFGVRWRPGYVRHFALWPIERYELRDDDWVRDELFTLLPFFQYHEHLDRKTKESYRRWQLWPFVHARQEADGRREVQALSILPFRDERAEDLLLPWVTLYSRREDPQLGSTETQLLFGLAGWRSAALPGQDRYDRVSAMFGLFQYRKRGREKGLRFFYLPELTWEAD
jgi:hypothetical protein